LGTAAVDRVILMETILHLTDMHFGWEGKNPSGLAERKVCLDSLLNEMGKLESPWKPTIICLTGDIGWSGSEEDYKTAKLWLDQLLGTCGLSYDSLVVCAGNHDADRSTANKLARPASAAEADTVLAPPIAPHYESVFANFIAFCRNSAIPSLKFGEYDTYLVGERIINNFRFISLNSAWNCKDDFDSEKLWIGQPHLKFMESHGQLVLHPDQANRITIALLHHPPECIHRDEKHESYNRPNTFDYLALKQARLDHGRETSQFIDLAEGFSAP
jgi:hypothetical protein